MRSPGGGRVAGLNGTGFAAARRAAGLAFLTGARRTGAFLAGFLATLAVFLRATGRLAGAFLRLVFAFFLAAICDLPAGTTALFVRDTGRYILIHPRAGSKREG